MFRENAADDIGSMGRTFGSLATGMAAVFTSLAAVLTGYALYADSSGRFACMKVRELRDEGRVMLVSTHNLGSVPRFCDRVVLVKGTVLAYGPTETSVAVANSRRRVGDPVRIGGPIGGVGLVVLDDALQQLRDRRGQS